MGPNDQRAAGFDPPAAPLVVVGCNASGGGSRSQMKPIMRPAMATLNQATSDTATLTFANDGVGED